MSAGILGDAGAPYATLVSALASNLFTVGEVPGFHGWSYGAFALQTLWAASTPRALVRHDEVSAVVD